MPPLDYDRVYRLKAAHPELTIVLNGGIADLDEAAAHLQHVDGVMLGRAAYQTPYILAEVDRRFFDASAAVLTRAEVLEAAAPARRAPSRSGRAGSTTSRATFSGSITAAAACARLPPSLERDSPCRMAAGVEVLLEALSLAEPSRRPPAAAE